MKSGLYLSENKDSTDSPRGLYLSKEKTSSTQNNAIRLGGALYSQDPRENYKGLDVPAGHSALFRAMDGQDRFYAEIMRKQQEEQQTSLKQALNQAAQKAMTELNLIKNNHLTVFNSKVKDEISIKILDPFIFELLKKNPIADLSHYSLNVLKHIRESYKLKDSINIENIIKDNLGYLLTDYREVYNNISDPFKAVISDLFKAGSQIEIDSIKNAFLQNSNHLNDYFEYSEDNNNQSPITEIICKESLLKIIEDIGLKLENLNKAKSEQNNQEYLSRIEASNEEEKVPHNDIENKSSKFNLRSDIKKIEEQEESSIEDLVKEIEGLRGDSMENADPEFNKAINEMLSNISSISSSPNKPSTSSEVKAQIKKELEWVKFTLQQHNEQLEKHSEQLGKINSQQAALKNSFSIQQNNALQDYYKGFINEFSKAFTSAQVVLGGQLKIEGTKSISVKITSQLAKFIPLLGDGISSAIQEGANYKVNVEEQHKCLNISKFGITNANLERLSKYIVNFIVSDPRMKEFIENYNPTETAGFFNKIGKVANKVKDDFDNKLDKLNTVLSPQELLGHKHAAQILKDYISSGSFKDSTLDEIVNLFISVILPENIQEENANIQPVQFIEQNEEEKNQGEDDDLNFSNNSFAQSNNSKRLVQQEIVPMSELEKALALIKQLQDDKVAKELRIQELENQVKNVPNDIEIMQRVKYNQEQIQKMAEESMVKDQIIRDKDNVNQEQKREINNAYKTITKQDHTIDDLREYKDNLKQQVQEQKELASHWKSDAEGKKIEIDELKAKLLEFQNQSEFNGTEINYMDDFHNEDHPTGLAGENSGMNNAY